MHVEEKSNFQNRDDQQSLRTTASIGSKQVMNCLEDINLLHNGGKFIDSVTIIVDHTWQLLVR